MGQGLQATVLGQTVQVAPKVKLEVCFLPLSILHFDSTLEHPPFPSPGEVLGRFSVQQDLSRCHFPQGFILGLKTCRIIENIKYELVVLILDADIGNGHSFSINLQSLCETNEEA